MDTKTLPLEGVRVLDLAVVWAGPFGTMQLGDLGAEIVKVENIHVWQPMARGGMARPDPPPKQPKNHVASASCLPPNWPCLGRRPCPGLDAP